MEIPLYFQWFAHAGVFTSPDFFIHGVNASIWTISIEVMLYIFLSALLYVGFLKRQNWYRYLCLLLSAGCFLTVSFNASIPNGSEKYFDLVGIFFFGGFCSTISLTQRRAVIITAVLAMAFLLLKYIIPSTLKLTFIFYLIISLLVWIIGFSKQIKLRLHNDISYGLYLIAFPIQQIVFMMMKFQQNVMLHLLLTLVIAVPLAFLSWRYIEKPWITFGLNKKAGTSPAFR